MAQITAGLTNGGATPNFNVSYDNSLPPQFGLDIAQGLMDNCEDDLKLMGSWFPGGTGQFPYSLPINVQLVNNSAGGSWGGPIGIANINFHPTVQLGTAPGTPPTGYNFTPDANFARYLLVAEVTEMLMNGMGDTWTEGYSTFSAGDEGSKGEALSRFLAAQFKLANGITERYSNFEVVQSWLNIQGRPDLAIGSAPDDISGDSTVGCATCLLYFLHDQLGFSIQQIINAGATTLASVFFKLTGTANAYFDLVFALNTHYPQSLHPPIAGVPAFISYALPGDNVFPVPNLDNLEGSSQGPPSLEGGSKGSPVVLGLDRITPLNVIVALSSDDPMLLTVPASVTIPAGDNGVGGSFAPIEMTAALVPGPARSVAIHATYAGKTLTTTVSILPPPSTLQGHVRNAASVGIDDASVLLQSNALIPLGNGDTMQLSTNQTGAYNSGVIPIGTYQVSAVQDGYVSQTVPVTIIEGVPITTKDFMLAATLPYIVEGTISDAHGAGIGGAAVNLDGGATTTNAAGAYTISENPNIYVGPSTLSASAPGYAPNSKVFSIPNGATLIENLTLAELGSLTGVVANSSPAHQPIAGAVVWAGAASTRSDASGHYSLASVPPGVTTVTVTAHGYDSAAAPVTIAPGVPTTQNFFLIAGTATITGTVTAAAVDGSVGPIAKATVSCSAGVATTATDGSYKIAGIPAGSLQVTASAKYHTASRSLVQLADHQTLNVDFELASAIQPPNKPPGTVV